MQLILLRLVLVPTLVAVATTLPPPLKVSSAQQQPSQRTSLTPGVTDTSITVGAVIPIEGPLSNTGAAMRAVLTAYFEELNARGGIHKRSVNLRFVDATTDPDVSVSIMHKEIETNQLFAMVGGVIASREKATVRLAENQHIPFVGPATLLPEEAGNHFVFYLSSGAAEQAKALVNFAASKPEIRKSKLAIVFPADGGVALQTVPAIEAQAKKLGWQNVGKYNYIAGDFAATTFVAKLRGENPDVVFVLSSVDHTHSFIRAAAAVSWYPHLFMPSFSFRDVSIVPREFKDRVFIGFPSVPADVTAAGTAEFTSLRQKYKLPEGSVASQITALAAAKVFVAAATSAGRDLTREKLIKALEGLSNLDTELTPKITFGPTRRIGARGAYIIAVDVEKQRLLPLHWVEAN